MSKNQSRRTQRALERELFGPTPRAHVSRPRVAVRYVDPSIGRYTHGSCPHCGNICTTRENYTCPSCLAFYPANQTTAWNADGTSAPVEKYSASGEPVWPA